MKAFELKNALQGKVALVTGANQGLGEAIAWAYAEAGAKLALCARDLAKLNAVADQIKARYGESAVMALACDVAKSDSAEAFVKAAHAHFGRIDALVNNAGVYGPMGNIEEIDWSVWVEAIEVNLLGSVQMARLVLPIMRAQGRGKIVQISGGGATNPMAKMTAYAASKAAVVRFAESIAEETRGEGIDVNCIAPGALNTRLLDQVLEAGPERVGQDFYERSLKQQQSGGAGLQAGSELAVYLASDASNGLTGKLISAIWDPWRQFDQHAADLESAKGKDVYTLRRITARDRGFGWEQA